MARMSNKENQDLMINSDYKVGKTLVLSIYSSQKDNNIKSRTSRRAAMFVFKN